MDRHAVSLPVREGGGNLEHRNVNIGSTCQASVTCTGEGWGSACLRLLHPLDPFRSIPIYLFHLAFSQRCSGLYFVVQTFDRTAWCVNILVGRRFSLYL